MGKRGENQRMSNRRTRGGREEPQTVGDLGSERQSQVSISAAGGMVVDADPVEAGVFAASNKGGDVAEWPANRHPDCDGAGSSGELLRPIIQTTKRCGDSGCDANRGVVAVQTPEMVGLRCPVGTAHFARGQCGVVGLR
jgi:hypothetical protein